MQRLGVMLRLCKQKLKLSIVPAFSVTKKNGGSTFAIYPHGNRAALRQVEQLREESRIDYFAEADYREDTTAYLWIKEKIQSYANRIIQDEKNKQAVVGGSPHHLI